MSFSYLLHGVVFAGLAQAKLVHACAGDGEGRGLVHAGVGSDAVEYVGRISTYNWGKGLSHILGDILYNFIR